MKIFHNKNKFIETAIFQVKPEKVEQFENILKGFHGFAHSNQYLKEYTIMKRTHRIADQDTVKKGKPAKKLTRIVKSVKYVIHLEFDNEADHGMFTKEFFEAFDKEMSKCLLVPHDKMIGIKI
jgi:hypothetical protein